MSNWNKNPIKTAEELMRIRDFSTDLNLCFKSNYYTVLIALNGLLASDENLAVYLVCDTAHALRSLLARIDLVDQLHEFKPAINLILKRIANLEEEMREYHERMREIVQTETPKRQTYGAGMSIEERRAAIHRCAARGANLFSEHNEIGSDSD